MASSNPDIFSKDPLEKIAVQQKKIVAQLEIQNKILTTLVEQIKKIHALLGKIEKKK